MTSKQIKSIKKLVASACKRKTNMFGSRAWDEHIVPVMYFAKLLAKKLHADGEIVELAAVLHDYASVSKKEWYPQHHRIGARLAGEVLYTFHYPPERIRQVQHCIMAHRASQRIPAKTLEAKIIASADSMAHFANVSSLLYLAFVQHKLSTTDGTQFVLNKLRRSWKKLMPEAKEILGKKYQAIKRALAVEKM